MDVTPVPGIPQHYRAHDGMLVERVLCRPADTRLLSLLSRRIYGLCVMRAAGRVFKRSSGTHFPIRCLSCDARRDERHYLPTVRIWPRISPPGERTECTFA